MIRYTLSCARGHRFDGWFKTSASCESQAKRGLVACPTCGTTKVQKAIMAPSVKSPKRREGRAKAAAPAPMTMNKQAAERISAQREMAEILRRIRSEVEAKAEYVGDRFAEEARKIHYDETPARGIYGEATVADAQALADEGIEVMPLPMLPEDRN
jgi:hypothetical protein